MEQATLDLLDSSLRGGFDKYATFEQVDQHKAYEFPLIINPHYWTKYHPLIKLGSFSWVDLKFSELDKHIAGSLDQNTKIGIYIFYVQPPELVNGFPRYAFYVGIAGEGGSRRPLQVRLQDYLNINKIKKRKKVHQFLQMFYPFVWVSYSLMDAPPDALAKLEEALHGFLYPWACDRDFPPDIKEAQKAWSR